MIEADDVYQRLCRKEDQMPYSVLRTVSDAWSTGDTDVLFALEKFAYGDHRYPPATVVSTTRALQRVGLDVPSELSTERIEAHGRVVKAYAECDISSSAYKRAGLAVLDLMHRDIGLHHAVEALVKERCIIDASAVREMLEEMNPSEQPLSRGLL